MILRDYQEAAVRSIWKYFESGKKGNPLVAAPTGTGKSLIIAGFIKSVYKDYPRTQIMMLTHVKELIQQNHDTLLKYWPYAPIGIVSSGLKRNDYHSPITFAGIATVVKRANIFGHIDMILIDEAHLVSNTQSTMYRKFIDDLKLVNPKLKVIGFTATPYRASQGLLTEGENAIFTDVCIDLTALESFNWLLDQGYIVPLIPKKTKTTLDVDDVGIRGGEYKARELQLAVDKMEVTKLILNEVMQLGANRKSWLLFATGIEHAEHINELLIELGIKSAVVHGGNKDYKMTAEQRNQNISDFKTGKIQALVNNNVLTTGFDHPSLDLIAMLRPTASVGLWVQMLGRGTRPVFAEGFDLSTQTGRLSAIEASHKKNCLVLDFAGNTARLGPINDPLIPKTKGNKTGSAPTKLCQHCEVYNHISATFCMSCGADFPPPPTKLQIQASNDELIKRSLPEVHIFKIDHMSYKEHYKLGTPNMVKVTYYCGLRMFNEYVCVGHQNYARVKAVEWWRKRAPKTESCPTCSKEALALVDYLKVPYSLRVWVNKEYPEIMDVCFDDTLFGTDFDGGQREPDVEVQTPSRPPMRVSGVVLEDDEIPF